MDWIAEGTTALISGMSAVFMILILISLMISGLESIGKLGKKQQKESPVSAPKTGAEAPEPKADQADDQQKIIAAITVALSQELNMSTDHFVVKKLRRV